MQIDSKGNVNTAAKPAAPVILKPVEVKIDPALLTHKVRVRHQCFIEGVVQQPGDEITVTEKQFAALSRFFELLEAPAASPYAELADKAITAPAGPAKP